ncbi:MAG: mechanosensitive ion channel family protein [Phycisphaeraceae bacterium]
MDPPDTSDTLPEQSPSEAIPSLEEASETITRTLRDILNDFLAQIPALAVGLLLLLLTAVAAAIVRRFIRQMVEATHWRESLKVLAERFATMIVWILGLLLAIMVVFPDISPGDGLAALGIGSIAVGLAFRDIFENLFAGVLILWRFPFENGDFIDCQGHSGKVISVTVRNTIIRTVEGELLVIPNATIYKNVVRVLTHQPARRQTISCGVAYGESVSDARRTMQEALDSCRTPADARPREVFAQGFGASSIDFEITWWCGSTPQQIRESRDEIVQAIKDGLDTAGIEIPFPYRTLVFKDDSPLRMANKQIAQTTDKEHQDG